MFFDHIPHLSILQGIDQHRFFLFGKPFFGRLFICLGEDLLQARLVSVKKSEQLAVIFGIRPVCRGSRFGCGRQGIAFFGRIFREVLFIFIQDFLPQSVSAFERNGRGL